MLHTKFRQNRSAGSGEEDFWRVFTIYGRGGHLGHVTQMPCTNFRSHTQRRPHIIFGFDWPSGFWEEDVWNCGRRRTTTTDGRTPDHGYLISSSLSLRLRWAKIVRTIVLQFHSYFKAFRNVAVNTRLAKRLLIFSAIIYLYLSDFCSGEFPLQLGAWDGLYYFIVALPGHSI